jgi:hypothetical protein
VRLGERFYEFASLGFLPIRLGGCDRVNIVIVSTLLGDSFRAPSTCSEGLAGRSP